MNNRLLRRRGWEIAASALAGAAGVMLILAIWFPITSLTGLDYAPTLASNAIIEFTPPDNAIFLQNALGAASFPFALLGGIMLTGLLGFPIGALYSTIRPRSRILAAIAVSFLLPILMILIFPAHMTLIALLPLIAIGPLLALITRRDQIFPSDISVSMPSVSISRRTFLIRGAIYSFGGLLLSAIDGFPAYQYALNAARAGAKLFDFTPPAPRMAGFPVTGDVPEITPVHQFYVMRKFPNSVPPAAPNWTITLDGLVDHPLTLNWADIQAFQRADMFLTRECVSNPVGGNLISTALMSGARLSDVLDRAGVQSKAIQLVFYGRDGYSESVPIDHARQYGMLVYAMNGVLLPDAHGAPVKVEVPGLYGFKNMKWLTRISAVDTPYQSIWTQEGWTATAIYKTMSRVDAIIPHLAVGEQPSGVTVVGIAFAGLRGISKVEVQINGGDWRSAILNTPPLSDKTWAQWRIDYATKPSDKSISATVRAYDGTGTLQTTDAHLQFPDGATGLHSLTMPIS